MHIDESLLKNNDEFETYGKEDISFFIESNHQMIYLDEKYSDVVSDLFDAISTGSSIIIDKIENLLLKTSEEYINLINLCINKYNRIMKHEIDNFNKLVSKYGKYLKNYKGPNINIPDTAYYYNNLEKLIPNNEVISHLLDDLRNIKDELNKCLTNDQRSVVIDKQYDSIKLMLRDNNRSVGKQYYSRIRHDLINMKNIPAYITIDEFPEVIFKIYHKEADSFNSEYIRSICNKQWYHLHNSIIMHGNIASELYHDCLSLLDDLSYTKINKTDNIDEDRFKKIYNVFLKLKSDQVQKTMRLYISVYTSRLDACINALRQDITIMKCVCKNIKEEEQL